MDIQRDINRAITRAMVCAMKGLAITYRRCPGITKEDVKSACDDMVADNEFLSKGDTTDKMFALVNEIQAVHDDRLLAEKQAEVKQ